MSGRPTPPIAPPVPARRPVVHRLHGDVRIDEYAWLRDRDDPAVVAHLEAENAWTAAMLEPTAALRERVYTEMVGRIQETDSGAPVPDGPWRYYTRTVEALQYPIHCRRHAADGAEQVLLDENALSAGHDYFHLGDAEVSPDHRMLAYSVDVTGSEVHTLRFRDLGTGADLAEAVERTYYTLAWSADSTTVFYTRPDAAMRPYQVWRHHLGDPADQDALVFEEADERFFAGVARTRSGTFIVLTLASQVTTEVHLLRSDEPGGAFSVVEPRRQGVEYTVDHHDRRLYIVTNDEALNFRLMRAPAESPARPSWQEVIPHRDDVKLDGIDLFARHAVLYERAGGLRRIRVMRLSDGAVHTVAQPESVYTASPGPNRDWDTDTLRFTYSSLISPVSAIDYGMESRQRTVVKQQPVLGGYAPADYVTGRLWATAPDGTRVPISYVHRADVALDGSAPCLLYGYGAYEISIDPTFSSHRISLLDRGVVYAIAHVRGGGELGRRWYEDGKLLRKPNTFSDFVACADHLVAERITAPDRLAIRGGSAGGLLMGAVVNLRPDLAAAVVAQVPFVDCLTTMLDPTLPLTVIEYEEWGNPEDPEVYRCMRAYSPYDNVAGVEHPAILVTAGLNDPRVGFWEPAKWVARLRQRTTGRRPVLLRTELGAGHAGPSGRYDAWREEALVLAFVLDRLVGVRGTGG